MRVRVRVSGVRVRLAVRVLMPILLVHRPRIWPGFPSVCELACTLSQVRLELTVEDVHQALDLLLLRLARLHSLELAAHTATRLSA